MTALLAFLFVIGILVFIHELGHFLVAKWCGVRVEKFSLGFGKKLMGFTRGETEYLISALPLGGYVKMYGEGTEDNIIVDRVDQGSEAEKSSLKSGDRITKIENFNIGSFSTWKSLIQHIKTQPQNEISIDLERDSSREKLNINSDVLSGIDAYTEKEYPRAFSNKSIWQRFLVIFAGPLMNFILPFLFIPIVYMVGITVPAYLEKTPIIGYVNPGSPSFEAGFQVGDEIKSINGKIVKNWRETNIAFQSNPDSSVNVEINRNGKNKTLQLKTVSSSEGTVVVGFTEPLEAKIGDIIPGSPAEKAGLKKGDKIIQIDNELVSDWDNMASIIRESAEKEITLLINRDGKKVSLTTIPDINPENDKGAIGITLYKDEIVKKFGFFESIKIGIVEAAKMIYEVTLLFLGFLYKLISGKIALSTAGKSIAGPLFIAKISGSAAESGLGQLLQFTSFISINLAVINLLPIPMLDGGHILFLGLEKIKGKSLNRKTVEITQRIGFTMLIFIMFLAIYNDIARLNWIEKLLSVFQ